MSRTTMPGRERAVRPSREQSVALGKAARAVAPRSGHCEFRAGRVRADPLALLEGQGTVRVPELLPIRYGRMAASAFAYFRGAALPMASDLAGTPATGLTVQACGDAHLANFGLFASPERRLVFDINDFDETLPGPWEWDVKRLATSLEIAGRANEFTPGECARIVEAAVRAYRLAMRRFADMGTLEVWYARADIDSLESLTAVRLRHAQRKRLARSSAKARSKDNLGALERFAVVTDDGVRLESEPPLVVPISELFDDPAESEELRERLRYLLADYRASLGPERRLLLDRFVLADMARKVVGVGSVGTRSWMLLLLGDDGDTGLDPLFLQAKEAGPSVLEAYTGPSEFDNCGQRVVVGQRLMQAVSDIFLGWVRVPGSDGRLRDFYVRQLRDWKGSAEVDAMVPRGMRAYGELCGWTLARAHARSGDRIAIAAYLGAGRSFDRAVRAFAEAYADQNERDHRQLVDAIAAGRVPAQPGI
ncbi:DUF2252 domain-containing protein [Nocardia yamanashiensis]|uniref:DUF2252 domain-containing protein n=1 Tax=Nocardia yamanashiensis TaxID=209247 RepID=UPI00083306C0